MKRILVDMTYIDFESIIISCDDKMRERLSSLLEVVGLTEKRCFSSYAELSQMPGNHKPAIVICDFRNCTYAMKNEVARLFSDLRKYHCICICAKGQKLCGDFSAKNFCRLEENFGVLDFFFTYFTAMIDTIRTLTESLLGYIPRDRIEDYIREILYRLGFTPMSRGFEYLTCAIAEVVFDRSLCTLITKNLFVIVAKRFSTSESAVEKAIRLQIHTAYQGEYKLKTDLLFRRKKMRKGFPIASEFIPWIAEIVRKEIDRMNRLYDSGTFISPKDEFRFDPAIGGGIYSEESIDDFLTD